MVDSRATVTNNEHSQVVRLSAQKGTAETRANGTAVPAATKDLFATVRMIWF